ncbi:MAG: ATP synthase F0 subunit B [Desulfovibrionaceae bacterium]|nr:ATP synthase F0 subunit B [Desulfovibrionaceae bacterium]MBF0513004.1 ATP synthase F0 subunit B [Desulfovibrionaceae bacterium]
MIDIDQTFLIQLINFLFILVTLNFILIRPIRAIIAKRAAWMSGRVGEIEKFTASATSKMKDYESALEKARIEATAVRVGLRDEGVASEKKIVEDAGSEVTGILSSARAAIASEAAAALTTLTAKVGQYSLAAAGKILGRSL